MNPYDKVTYASRSFRQTHPDRLATIATLWGLSPPPVDRCRVLELGCALGSNLLPMAEQLPNARLVGVDASGRQIEIARGTAKAAGLTNVELIEGDLRSIGPDLGEFDYIIAHGIYSWVPGDAQDQILNICGQQLAPSGVAYVSYNCYPGWHLRGSVHQLLRYATRECDDPVERIRRARRLAEALAQSIAAEANADAAGLKQELELVVRQQDSYLFHEYLAEVNEPVYFHEFMARAAGKGLQYLADVDLGLMSPDSLPHPVKQQLTNLTSGPLEMEQYFDFVKNRKFRQTLLCRRDAALDGLPQAQRVRSLYVASGARAEGVVDLGSDAPATYRNQVAAMVSHERPVKAAMHELAENWPRAVFFDSLLAAARERMAGALSASQARLEDDAALLAGLFLTGFSTSLIELSTHSPTFTLQPSERPLASPIARCQAELSETVTNRRHENVGLDYVQRLMLPYLDGDHDRADIVTKLLGLVHDGTLVIHDQGEQVMNPARARALLTEAVELNLGTLARLALLVG